MPEAPIRAPRSLNEAQRLCEAFTEVDAKIATIEEARDVAIAKVNAEFDNDLSPLIKRREALTEKIEPWFLKNKQELLKGKRKSAELGGVMMGTRTGSGKVTVTGAIDAVIEKLRANTTLGRLYVRPRYELDKPEIRKGLTAKHGPALKALGLGFEAGAESFFIERTGQAATQTKLSR